MADLFTLENKIKIVELTQDDILRQSDVYCTAFELIRKHEDKYPNIDKWFKNKVLPDIEPKERAFYIGYQNDKAIASAVVKKGEDSKFCHLHIDEEYRHQNVGDIFFLLMSLYIKRYAKRVHFSLPEGLWEEKKYFFNSFGFDNIENYSTQYRSSEKELTSSVSFPILWKNILEKIPDLIAQFSPHPDSPLNGIVMSIHPNYTNQIFEGTKCIEIRKKFSKKWKNHTVTIYSSKPTQGLVGYAKIKDVVEETPDNIWHNYSDKLGCTKSEFESYTKDARRVYAVFLTDINKFTNDLSLNYLSIFLEKKIVPPQSYFSVSNANWKSIITIAEMLHGRFNLFSQVI